MYNWDADFLGKTGQVSPIFVRPVLEHATVCPIGAKMQNYLSHEGVRVSEGGIAINRMFNLKLKQLYFKTKVYLQNSPKSLSKLTCLDGNKGRTHSNKSQHCQM